MIFRRLVAPLPYWHYVKLPFDRRVDSSVDVVKRTIEQLIADARERMRADEQLRRQPSNMMEAMLRAADEDGSEITDDDVVGNVLTMLLAGEDTAANTLAWLVWLLHNNPTALGTATAEVGALAADLSELSLEKIGRLDYLEACVHEALRLRPVVTFFLGEAVRETSVGDVRVPAGTVLWFVTRHDTLKDKYFERASAFEPHRWLAEGERGANSAKRVSMPFGGGPRMCPGRYLALAEIKLAMAMLLGRFELLDVTAQGGGEPQERLSFTMGPAGLRMRLREKALAS